MTEHKPVLLSAGTRQGAPATFRQHVPNKGWYSGRIGECIDWEWFQKQFPQRTHELLNVDLMALSEFVPTFHREGWPHPRFWSLHWQDLASAVMDDGALRERFARTIPPVPPGTTCYYFWRSGEGNTYLAHLMKTTAPVLLAHPEHASDMTEGPRRGAARLTQRHKPAVAKWR